MYELHIYYRLLTADCMRPIQIGKRWDHPTRPDPWSFKSLHQSQNIPLQRWGEHAQSTPPRGYAPDRKWQGAQMIGGRSTHRLWFLHRDILRSRRDRWAAADCACDAIRWQKGK